MATSPLFGWQEPDDTSLVKDGAAAIRTLGNAIDSSMGDLLGGTTGQVLAKASNTNMDFTWVAQDDSNAIQNAIVDAKGDLIAASANDTPARLAVGANGETLVADSSTSTGLRYQTSANGNFCINGGMDIWQRGTSFTIASGTPQYTADRWTNYFNGTGTIAQETSIKPDTSIYSLKMTATASSSDNAIFQLVEQANMEQFRGKVVTLSVKLAGTVGLTPSVTLAYSTTANDTLTNTSTQITAGSTINPAINASTFVTWALTFTVPTTAKQLRIGVGTGSVVNTNVLYVAEVELELGSVATTFKKSGGTIQGELAACQRYYWRAGGLAAYQYFGIGMAFSSTTAGILVNNPVPMRVSPTSIDFSTLGVSDTTTLTAVTNVTADILSPIVSNLNITVASGLTQYRTYRLLANNSTSAYLGFSAEL